MIQSCATNTGTRGYFVCFKNSGDGHRSFYRGHSRQLRPVPLTSSTRMKTAVLVIGSVSAIQRPWVPIKFFSVIPLAEAVRQKVMDTASLIPML
ncbi:hypothetical protein PISMIDRAFT_681809 [Pisolithus microcarpus 441]|uniref:Unplaced genomic scaffold scaffold_73, whole genome shotgun sequence n=1 Tax=Pisolithus microcarpus 441 TaxID=765257 RepID=A0A0C9Z4C6_9AGAM|nr:hypothetical protein BKA83DRAFT_681809 [Pisolithus microcarpus]KIK20984.1 hypothetical protein PISMIDRAFT_681809 [Pisolithus microcarpus 441]